MVEEQQIQVGGAAATMGFDSGDGTQEFLKRTKYKSKIDQVIDFYGVPYCYKNNIDQFLRYSIQPRHYPIVHEHFYQVLKSTGYGVDDFDYAKLQEEYNARQDKTPVGIELKIDMKKFQEQNPVEQFMPQQDQMQLMKDMMNEIKELKEKFLSSNKPNEGTNTTGESETSEETKSTGEIAGIGTTPGTGLEGNGHLIDSNASGTSTEVTSNPTS